MTDPTPTSADTPERQPPGGHRFTNTKRPSSTRGLFGPLDRVADRQMLGPDGVQVLGKLREHLALAGEFVTHGPARNQVVGYGGAVIDHRALPGQGTASSRSAR